MFAPYIQESLVEMVEMIPHGRVSERMVDQTVDFPVLETMEETVQVFLLVPQERIRERIEEETIGRGCEAHPTGPCQFR